MSDDTCLDSSNAVEPVNLIRCHGLGGNQAWVYDSMVDYFITHKNKPNIIIIINRYWILINNELIHFRK